MLLPTSSIAKNKMGIISTSEEAKLPIGQILKDAGLISTQELDLALQNQRCDYKGLKLGEILEIKGWVKRETTDFFVSCWHQLTESAQIGSFRQKIGDYLYDAHLLTTTQIGDILQQQRATNMLFGHLAVARGYIKQETLDFFVKHLFLVSSDELKIESHLNCGQIYLGKKEFKDAILSLREALKLGPNNCRCHALLAEAYLKCNQMSLAKIHFKKAMQLNPDEALVQKLCQKIPVTNGKTQNKSKSQSNNHQKSFLAWFTIF